MFNKKLMMLAIFIVSLLAISVVSAADNVTDEVVSVEETNEVVSISDNNVNSSVSSNENGYVLSVEDQEDIGATEENKLSATPGTFTDLANEISNAGDELNLTKDYFYSSNDSSYNEGIIINKKITINGNGFTINGNNQAKALKVDYNNVVLKKISFVNCFSNNGGAVLWSGTNGTLSNCSFINCSSSSSSSSSSSGGAIYWRGSDGIMYNCSFRYCSASFYGGFVYWIGVNGSVYNCYFVNSSHNRYGSAIYWSGNDGYLGNSSFINCSTIISYSNSRGGVVYWQGINGFLSNCSFLNCSLNFSYSLSKGGHIYWDGINGFLSNCSFVNCPIYGIDSIGCNIYWHGDNAFLFGCNLENNHLNDDGSGYVRFESANCYLSNCNFTNFHRTKYRAITCVNSKSINVTIFNCSFENCSSSINGGVISFNTENEIYSYISNCSFVNCFSSKYGGVIYCYCSQDNNFILSNCSFVNCSSTSYGGVIYWKGINSTLIDCDFINCSSSGYGGVIYAEGINAFDCDFINCSSKSQGGAIYNFGGENSTIFNCSFKNCFAKNGAGAILWNGKNGTLYNCSFMNCNSTGTAGAVYFMGDNGELNDCIFINCCGTQGGGIYWANNGKLFNSTFINCLSSDNGGGVYLNGKGSLINCTFINNTASKKGSGVYMYNGYMINCTFINDNYYWYRGQVIKRNIDINCTYSSFNYTNPIVITTKLINAQIGLPCTGSIYFYFVRDINRTGSNCTCYNCNCIDCNCSNETEMNFTDFYYFEIALKDSNTVSLYEELNNLSIGSWRVDVWYGGDNNYGYASANFNINITSSKSTNLVISTADNYYYDKTTGILVKVLSNNTIVDEGFVTLYDNDEFIGTYRITGKQMINYTPRSIGDHNITIYYDGGIFYKNCENSTNIIVSKASPKINVSSSNLTDNGITFSIIMNGNETGDITININNNSYKSNITNGKAIINVPISYGEYTYTISYSGDKNYNPYIFEYKNQFRYNVDYSISPNIIFAGNTLNFNFKPDATGKIIIKIFNKTYNGALIDGKFIIDGFDVKGGIYNFTIDYEGNAKYNPIFIEYQLNILFKDSPFNIGDSKLTYGDTLDLTYVLPNGATGILEILVDENPIKNISIGNEYKYNALNGGKHYLTLKYSGDEYFKANETTIELDIKKFDSILIINDTIDANPTSNIVVKLNEDATGLITVTINNKKYSSYLIKGTYDFNTNKLTAGINIINIKYDGNEKYNSFNLDKEINVLLKDPNLIFDTNNIISGNGLPIKPTVASGASGTFKIYVDDALKTTINVGTTYYLYQQSLGKHEIKIVYSGDNYFKSETSSSIFRVFAKYPIEASDMKIINGSSKYFQAKFYDEYGEILSNKYVIFNVDGGDYSIRTNSKGIAILNIDLDIGEHNITTINPTASENTTNKLLIFTSVESNDVYTFNNTDFEFNVTFLDNDAEKLMNIPVLFKINGEDKVVITNAEGVATLKLNLDIGIYNITTINTVTDESKINKLFVKSSSTGKYTREIDEKDINIPSLPSSSSESVTVKLPNDASGTITLNIDGKDYEFNVTDGIANINVPELSYGNYPYTITYSGDGKYSSFSKTGSLTVIDPKIVAKDIVVQYSSKGKYSVTVYGFDGKVASGVYVVFKINEKQVSNVKTDYNGVASYVVTNNPGTYRISATALGKTVTQKLTVKHIVTLKTVKVKKSAKKLILQATVKIGKKPMAKKKVTFKFNGKKYTAKTNKKGIAKVTIKKSVLKKLKVGKKIKYQATYLKDTVKKTVKVKK